MRFFGHQFGLKLGIRYTTAMAITPRVAIVFHEMRFTMIFPFRPEARLLNKKSPQRGFVIVCFRLTSKN